MTTWISRSRLNSTAIPASPRAASSSATRASTRFPTSLAFTDTSRFLFDQFLTFDSVPIYDGRFGFCYTNRSFQFTDADFVTLNSWPTLSMPELPDDAAVAIGYTVNSYKTQAATAGAEYTNLSTNIQFVILLGEYEEKNSD